MHGSASLRLKLSVIRALWHAFYWVNPYAPTVHNARVKMCFVGLDCSWTNPSPTMRRLKAMSMRDIEFSDASYVRLYTYDHPSWLDLSWQAKGVYTLLRRKADRAGLLPMSKKGLRCLAGHMGHPDRADEILPFIQELVDEGWLEVRGDVAIIPQFIESENAHSSNAARSRKSREKRRDMARAQSIQTHGDTSDATIDTPRNETLHRVAPSASSTVASATVPRHVEQNANEHVERNSTALLSISLTDPKQIPPISPQGGNGDSNGPGVQPIHEDPNLEDIRRKLLALPAPLRYLPSIHAEERLYAPVMGGALSLAHVLNALDEAAISLGPELGAIQPSDKPGLATLERFVAGCVKRARRERHAAPPAHAPASKSQPRASEPSPEALDALDRFREMYTSTGGYDRYVVGPGDEQLAADAIAECAKHGDPQKVLIHALDVYMRDDFFTSQGHTLKRFVAVLKSEPARFVTRKKRVETDEEKMARFRHRQSLAAIKDLEDSL